MLHTAPRANIVGQELTGILDGALKMFEGAGFKQPAKNSAHVVSASPGFLDGVFGIQTVAAGAVNTAPKNQVGIGHEGVHKSADIQLSANLAPKPAG